MQEYAKKDSQPKENTTNWVNRTSDWERQTILSKVSPNTYVVWCDLKSRQRLKGYCYPSQKTIAKACSISVSGVKLAIKSLQKIGLVVVEIGDFTTPNKYTLPLDEAGKLCSKKWNKVLRKNYLNTRGGESRGDSGLNRDSQSPRDGGIVTSCLGVSHEVTTNKDKENKDKENKDEYCPNESKQVPTANESFQSDLKAQTKTKPNSARPKNRKPPKPISGKKLVELYGDSQKMNSLTEDHPLYGFDKFWQAWENKINKKQTAKYWQELTLAEKRQAYLKIPDRNKANADLQSKGLTAMSPRTYINDRRFEDEQTQPTKIVMQTKKPTIRLSTSINDHG